MLARSRVQQWLIGKCSLSHNFGFELFPKTQLKPGTYYQWAGGGVVTTYMKLRGMCQVGCSTAWLNTKAALTLLLDMIEREWQCEGYGME